MREVDRAYWKMSTQQEWRVREEDGSRGGEADGRQMQGLLQSHHTGWRWGGHCSLLNGNFSQLPTEIALTQSQNTQTTLQMVAPHSGTRTLRLSAWSYQCFIQTAETVLHLKWLKDPWRARIVLLKLMKSFPLSIFSIFYILYYRI